MPHLFPDVPLFRGPHRPHRFEADVFEVEYDGEIPRDLDGAFYRCGADPIFPPRAGNDIGVNGDGFVSGFFFRDGHVDFRHRYVRTEKFLAERAARKALFGAYRNPYTDDPSVAGMDRTTANTSILWHAGRLYAIKEDSLPHELDPMTLETIGKTNFDGALRSATFTAHPKIDPDGNLVFYGYEASGLATDDIAVCVADPDGKLVSETWFKAPYPCLIHDYAITDNYYVFPFMPTLSDLERIKAGGDHWRWHPDLPTYIGILPRNGKPEDLRLFEGPARWSFHTMNAFERDGKVYLDTTWTEKNGFFLAADGTPPGPADTAFYLSRVCCDLSQPVAGARFTEERLYQNPTDFYDIDPRFEGRPYRYGFMAVKDRAHIPAGHQGPEPFNAIGTIDHATGRVTTWYAGDNCSVQEPVFVPKLGEHGEGEGYLVSVVSRHARNTSDLVVLDALHPENGPVALIHLPLHLKMAFHGEFVPAAQLDAGHRVVGGAR